MRSGSGAVQERLHTNCDANPESYVKLFPFYSSLGGAFKGLRALLRPPPPSRWRALEPASRARCRAFGHAGATADAGVLRRCAVLACFEVWVPRQVSVAGERGR